MGTGIVLIPLYKISMWLVAIQAVAVFLCLKNGIGILSGWNDKKRKYNILMERNSTEFRPDSFSEYMQAPCGRLLVKIVLEDLDRKESYRSLKALKKPFAENLKSGCTPVKTVVYLDGKKL